jgi:hypothetical protein
MAIALFHHFIVTFANSELSMLANPTVTSTVGSRVGATAVLRESKANTVYQIIESPRHHWHIFENGRPIALTVAQQQQLGALLAILEPPPNPDIVPALAGQDGIWNTLELQQGSQQTVYQWWTHAPEEWQRLETLIHYVRQIADIPQERARQQQKQLTQTFFEHLSARNLSGMLDCYHPNVQYSSSFLTLQGDSVANMWHSLWQYLPDLVVHYEDSDVRPAFIYWSASYTYPPTARRVSHSLTTHLSFVDGLIAEQSDRFNFHEWAANAYGTMGKLVGDWPIFQQRVQHQVRKRVSQRLENNADSR